MTAEPRHTARYIAFPLAAQERIESGAPYDVLRIFYSTDAALVREPKPRAEFYVDLWNLVMGSQDESHEWLRTKLRHIKDFLKASEPLSGAYYAGNVMRTAS